MKSRVLTWMAKRLANWVATGLIACLTIAWFSYALTYNWSSPASIRNKISGDSLTSTGWNLLVGNVDNLNERLATVEWTASTPSGAIMAFNLSNCPSWWSPADGTGGRPDLRGEFIRGWDNGRGIDASRTLASWQSDGIKDHYHAGLLNSPYSNGYNYSYGWNGWAGSPPSGGVGSFPASSIPAGNHDGNMANAIRTNITVGATADTRPRNVAFLYCIKN